MKFARYLASHVIDEWRTRYVDYRQLKKQIGRAENELMEMDDGKTPESRAGGTGGGEGVRIPPRKRQTTESGTSIEPPKHAAEDYEAHEIDLERGEEAEDSDDDERINNTMSKSPDTYAQGHLSRRDTDYDSTSRDRPSTSRRISGMSASDREQSDETTRTGSNLVPKSSPSRKGSRNPLSKTSADLFKPGMERLRSSDERQTLRKWRFGLTHKNSLEEVFEKIPPQSQRFFKLTDKELSKVGAFWADRMEQAWKRFDELEGQWKELADHKKEYQASRSHEMHAPKALKSVLPKHAHSLPGSNLVRRTFAARGHNAGQTTKDHSSGDEQTTPTDDKGKSPASDDADPNAKQRAALRHGRPEEYTHARSKLKLATFEFYRYLGMVKSYRVLNRTGFAKAVKKFEKVTSIPCGIQYKPKIENSDFVSSPELDDLIRRTEDAFATVFEHGNRKKALERLRDFGRKQDHHFAAWRAGLLMGAAIPLMIEGLVISWRSETRRTLPYWGALLQLFGACYLPVFFSLAFFINLATWNYGRINYVLIFELDVRSKLDFHQYLEIPAVLFFVLSLFFWAAFSNFWPEHIHPSAYPLAWLVFTLALLLNPLNVFYASSRWWMARSMLRVVSSGVVAVRFRDFFLGDELNSIYYSIYNLGFLYCTYNKGWPDDVQSICSTNKTWTTAVLASLPPFFRLGQSIRRYIDSDGLTLHLLNSGKYSATIIYFFFYFNWRIDLTRSGSSDDWRLALFIVFATINSIYVASWDVLLDWSLGKRNSKHPYLRQELGYFKDNWWLYYVFSVVNVILRFSWVLYLAPSPSPSVQSYIIALVEAARRIMWNTFRVEAEHIGNRDGYRVTRDVSLPYMTVNSPEANGRLPADEEDDDSSLPFKQRFFATSHRLHASLVKNLEPVIDVVVEQTGWWKEGWTARKDGQKDSDDDDEGVEDGAEQQQVPGQCVPRKKPSKEKVQRRRRRRSTVDGGESPSSEASTSDEAVSPNSRNGGQQRSDPAEVVSPDELEENEKSDDEGGGQDIGSQRMNDEQERSPNRRKMRKLSSDIDEDREEERESRKEPDSARASMTGDEEMQKEMDEAERMRNI